ncbi:MAG: NAD-dependent protein deacylase [Lachnospiraceae bacterium]|nr:NAD-dependent protein deacylase [Lachnospiraceae bacterium]
MEREIEILRDWIDKSDNIVFFGGAGVSTESGIPDFRSQDGLYHTKYKYPPETIVSHTFLTRKTEEFFDFYKEKMVAPVLTAMPNAAHEALAKWEKEGKLKAVITQNIDSLHQKAGSSEVLELHGTVMKNYCINCRREYSAEYVVNSKMVPRCEICEGLVRPDVVLYEEGLDMEVVNKAIQYISSADVLIVGGTSLVVYPAAGLIQYYKGNKLVLVNLSETSQDKNADLVIHGKIGEVFSKL